jgi:hypothetical protein
LSSITAKPNFLNLWSNAIQPFWMLFVHSGNKLECQV